MLIVTDADNTLWDTNSVYRDAQLAFFDEVAKIAGSADGIKDRLAYLRNIDQAIASKHKDHFRYPPILLAEALYIALIAERRKKNVPLPIDIDTTTLTALNTAADKFGTRVETTIPELRNGVREGLTSLKGLGASIIIVTEGSPERCKSLLQYYQLLSAVTEVVHTTRKGVVIYRQLADRYGVELMTAIGDQIEKDLYPAKEAGFITIYFPSELKFRWAGNANETYADYRIQSYDEIPDIVRKLFNSSMTSGVPHP